MYLYFFRIPNRNAAVTKSANSSAAEMASQTPSMSKKMGRISTVEDMLEQKGSELSAPAKPAETIIID